MDERLLPIGEFARASRLTVKALRHYDAEGVLVPASVDPATGYRSYARSQLRDALAISLLRSLGVGLLAVREVLAGGEALEAALQRERERLAREVARSRQALASIERVLRAGDLVTHPVTTVVEPARQLVWLAGEVDADALDRDVGALIVRLLSVVSAAGAPVAAPVVARFPAVLAGTVAVSAGIELAGGAPVPAGLVASDLPGGPHALVTHVGPYEELPLAYHALADWLHRSGQPADAPFLERYLSDPADTPPEALVTQVLVPLDEGG